MFGLIANVVSDKALRTGAKVHVLQYHGDFTQVEVTGLSKSGRRITKYLPWKRLTNIRAAFVPEHMRKEMRLWWKNDRAAVEKIAQELTDIFEKVRAFHPDGRLIKEGIPEGQALKEYFEKKNLPSYCSVAPLPEVEHRIKEIRESGQYYASGKSEWLNFAKQ